MASDRVRVLLPFGRFARRYGVIFLVVLAAVMWFGSGARAQTDLEIFLSNVSTGTFDLEGVTYQDAEDAIGDLQRIGPHMMHA